MTLPAYLPVGSTFKGKATYVNLLVETLANLSGAVQFSVLTGITAGVGGTQANAIPLTHTFNVISTVGSAADSVSLPAWAAGTFVFVYNAASANAANVLGLGTDTIDLVTAGTGVTLTHAKWAIFFADSVAGNWISAGGAGHSV